MTHSEGVFAAADSDAVAQVRGGGAAWEQQRSHDLCLNRSHARTRTVPTIHQPTPCVVAVAVWCAAHVCTVGAPWPLPPPPHPRTRSSCSPRGARPWWAAAASPAGGCVGCEQRMPKKVYASTSSGDMCSEGDKGRGWAPVASDRRTLLDQHSPAMAAYLHLLACNLALNHACPVCCALLYCVCGCSGNILAWDTAPKFEAGARVPKI